MILTWMYGLQSGYNLGREQNSKDTTEFIQTQEESKISSRNQPVESNIKDLHTALFAESAPDDPNAPWIENLGWKPRAFLFHNFITPEECQTIIELGQRNISKSLVVSDKGTGVESKARTSNGVFLVGAFMTKSPLLRYMEKKIAQWTQIPVENGEAFYLLKYEEGQQYKAHNDWFPDEKIKDDVQGNRMATVLIYLQPATEGGNTVFPNTNIRVSPKAGDALLFYDLTPTGEGDTNSFHAGEPVIKGSKWALTKWIRQKKSWYWYYYLTKEEQQKVDEEDKEYIRTRKPRVLS